VPSREALEASPLADLHELARETGLDGYRRLRKADLIDRLLGSLPGSGDDASGEAPARKRAPRKSVVNAGKSGIVYFGASDAASGIARATVSVVTAEGRLLRRFVERAGNGFELREQARLNGEQSRRLERTRSAAAPPLKTSDGWLLFYHAMDKEDPGRYKVGALLLDLKDPTKVLYRSEYPLLQPDEWYENDWKPGIIYASGAVIKDGTLFIYYGGGDKHIAVASVNLKEFIHKLKNKEQAVFSKKSVKVT